MKKVYLIDDDDIFVFLTKKTILKVSENVDVEVFSDGQQAITHLKEILGKKELLPDVIFLDLNMPLWMDGSFWLSIGNYILLLQKLMSCILYPLLSLLMKWNGPKISMK